MISLVIELCTAFIQFFISLATIPNFNMPASWKLPMNYLSVFNLDLNFLQMIIPEIGDFRIYFLAISVALPLTFIFFGLVFINPFRVVMWYLGVVSGVLMLSYGIFIATGTGLYDQSDAVVLSRNIFLIVGGSILLGCIVLYCIRNQFTCCQQKESEARALVEVKEEETKNQDSIAQLQRFCVFLVFGIAGALFCGLASIVDRGATQNAVDSGTKLANFGFGVGITLLILAFFAFVYMIVGCFKRGREFQWDLSRFFDLSFMRMLLIGLSLTFIPICAGVFVLFNCTDVSCPRGTRIMDHGSGLLLNSTNDVCPSCTAGPDTSCPANIRFTICNDPTQVQSRLQADKQLFCSDLQIYFWPAAFIVILQVMIGVPVVFQNMIMLSTTTISDAFSVKLPKEADPTDAAVVWSYKVAQCENVARFLFQPFRYETRYTRLFQLIEKLLAVFTGVFVFQTNTVDSATIGISCALVIHFIAGVLFVIYKPFIRRFENGLAIVMEAFLVVACAAALLIQRNVVIPEWFLILIFVLNGLLPLIAFIIGVVLEWSSSKDQEEQEAEEQRQMVEEELRKRIRADEEGDEGGDNAAASERTADNSAPPVVQGLEIPLPGVAPLNADYLGVSPYSHPEHHGLSPHEGPIGAPPPPTTPPQSNLTALKKKIRRQLTEGEKIQRANEVRAMVLKRRQEAALELLRSQQDTDLEIDRTVKNRLNRFLMVAGVLGFLALALCLVGLILVDSQNVKTANLITQWELEADSSTAVQLAGYTSWQEMTQNCCCSSLSVPSKSNYTAERWVCANGKRVERTRTYGGIDGTAAVRGLCQTSFAANCTAAVSATRVFSVRCGGVPVSKYF